MASWHKARITAPARGAAVVASSTASAPSARFPSDAERFAFTVSSNRRPCSVSSASFKADALKCWEKVWREQRCKARGCEARLEDVASKCW